MTLRQLDQDGNIVATQAYTDLGAIKQQYQTAKAQIGANRDTFAAASIPADVKSALDQMLVREERLLEALRRLVQALIG